jgi:hypothetical protein
MASKYPGVRAHASPAERPLRDPEVGSERAVIEPKREFVRGK